MFCVAVQQIYQTIMKIVLQKLLVFLGQVLKWISIRLQLNPTHEWSMIILLQYTYRKRLHPGTISEGNFVTTHVITT